jgi:hypothetical protein
VETALERLQPDRLRLPFGVPLRIRRRVDQAWRRRRAEQDRRRRPKAGRRGAARTPIASCRPNGKFPSGRSFRKSNLKPESERSVSGGSGVYRHSPRPRASRRRAGGGDSIPLASGRTAARSKAS